MYSYNAASSSSTMENNENLEVSPYTRRLVSEIAESLEKGEFLVHSCEKLAQMKLPYCLIKEFDLEGLAQQIYKTSREEVREAAQWLLFSIEKVREAGTFCQKSTKKPETTRLPLWVKSEERQKLAEQREAERQEQRRRTIQRMQKGREETSLESRKRKADVPVSSEQPAKKRSFLTDVPIAKKSILTEQPKPEAKKKTFFGKKSFVKKPEIPEIIIIE